MSLALIAIDAESVAFVSFDCSRSEAPTQIFRVALQGRHLSSVGRHLGPEEREDLAAQRVGVDGCGIVWPKTSTASRKYATTSAI